MLYAHGLRRRKCTTSKQAPGVTPPHSTQTENTHRDSGSKCLCWPRTYAAHTHDICAGYACSREHPDSLYTYYTLHTCLIQSSSLIRRRDVMGFLSIDYVCVVYMCICTHTHTPMLLIRVCMHVARGGAAKAITTRVPHLSIWQEGLVVVWWLFVCLCVCLWCV